jgi:hypothetical protein
VRTKRRAREEKEDGTEERKRRLRIRLDEKKIRRR